MQVTPEEIKDILQQYEHILLTAHVSPDGDAIGSMIGLYGCLRQWGKNTVMVIDDDIDERYDFLPSVKAIRKPADVVTDSTWLTVILDATDPMRTGTVEELMHGKVLNIDHHISNRHLADWEYVVPTYAAAGEVLTELFIHWHTEITQEMANALYMAIATDCGFFKFGNTTGHTLNMAAQLVDAGAQPNIISVALDAKCIEQIKVLAEVLQQIEVYQEGRVAGLMFTPELLAHTGEHTGEYIDYVRIIQGVEIAFTIKYVAPEETRISLRSKNVDVNKIAAVFGGGGHIRAAGATVKFSLENTKLELLKEIAKAL